MVGKRKAAPEAINPRLKTLRTSTGNTQESGTSVVASWIKNFDLTEARSPNLWSPKSPQDKPHLLTLPAEIRNMIFLLAIQLDQPILVQTEHAGPPIQRVCKQLRAETMGFTVDYLQNNTFLFTRGTKLVAWISSMGVENMKHIRSYQVNALFGVKPSISGAIPLRRRYASYHDVTITLSLQSTPHTGNGDHSTSQSIYLEFSDRVQPPTEYYQDRLWIEGSFWTALYRLRTFGHVELFRAARHICHSNKTWDIKSDNDPDQWDYFVWNRYISPMDGTAEPEENLDGFVAEFVARQEERETAKKKAKAKKWV